MEMADTRLHQQRQEILRGVMTLRRRWGNLRLFSLEVSGGQGQGC